METLFRLMYFLVAGDFDGEAESRLLDGHAFLFTLLAIFVISLLMSVIYYYLFNTLNSKLNFNKLRHWILILIINIIIGSAIFYSIIGTYVYEVGTVIPEVGWIFIVISTFYSALFFYIWSLIIKGKSHARFIPHIFPHSYKIRKK